MSECQEVARAIAKQYEGMEFTLNYREMKSIVEREMPGESHTVIDNVVVAWWKIQCGETK